MQNQLIQKSPALSLAFFGIRNLLDCRDKLFLISYPVVQILSPLTQFSNSLDSSRTLWISIKFAFALSLKKDDIVECSFYVDKERDTDLRRTLFINILPATFDLDQVYISYLCAFNLLPQITRNRVVLKLKRCKRLKAKPVFSRSVQVSLIRSSLCEDFVVDDAIKDYFSSQRLLRNGDVIVVKGFDKKYYRTTKLALKIMRMEGISDGIDAFISTGKSAIFQTTNTCGYIPVLESIPFLPPSLSQVYRKICQLIDLERTVTRRTPSRILLHGHSGAGHHQILANVAAHYFVPLVCFDCMDFWSEVVGTTIAKIKSAFQKLESFNGYCVVTFENINFIGHQDSETEKRDERILECFENCLKNGLAYCFLFTCNTPVSGSLSSRQRLLFLHDFGIPHLAEEDKFELLLNKLPELSSENIRQIAYQTKGFSILELQTLVDDALYSNFAENSGCLSPEDFKRAIGLRNEATSYFVKVPKIPELTWDDIGGVEDAKKSLQETMRMLINDGGYKRSGIILHGPPGCGKTLLAKALASQFLLPILNVKGPELLNKYVGESEANIRKVFECACQAAPCIIFFDELDSLAPRRGRSGDSGGVTDRIVSQLLTEMDEVASENVFVLGATNRLDLLDPSLLVPGRFDKTIFVKGGEDVSSRLAILRAASRNLEFTEDVDLLEIATLCNRWMSGADLYSVVSRAMLDAVRERIKCLEERIPIKLGTISVTRKNFLYAVKELSET